MFKLFGREVSIRIRIKKQEPPKGVNIALQNKLMRSYSQYYEDIFLWQLFQGKTSGTYIDIGANHPTKLSNTKKFYDSGWRGVTVEPNPKLHRLFLVDRPEDTSLNCGVGDMAGEMTFFEMEPDYYSTFDPLEAKRAAFSTSRKVVGELPVKIVTINDVFDYVKKTVDLLSVDTESFDFKVLSANNWQKNKPKVIVVEMNSDENNRVYNLLKKQGYDLVYYNGTNGIWVDITVDFISKY